MKVKPFHIDGLLYAAMGFFGAAYVTLSTDEAKDFVTPTILFWFKVIAAGVGGASLQIKTFRSTSYADHKRGLGEPPYPKTVETVHTVPAPAATPSNPAPQPTSVIDTTVIQPKPEPTP